MFESNETIIHRIIHSMKKLLFTAFLLSIYLLANAQTDFRKGYIITSNLDTIRGTVDFRGDMKNSENCIFKNNEDKTTTYHPGEIYGYRFENGKYYISKFVKEKNGTVKNLFAEFLVEGAKDLYYFRDMAGFHYLLDYKSDTLTEIPYDVKDIRKDGKDYQYESKQYIGYLKEYFKDCPSLYAEIDRIKKPEFNNLIKLTKDYHYKTCSDSSCIVYYQPKPLFKVAFEPQYGAWALKGYDYTSITGGLLYIWLPRANERLFLKTGLSFAKYTYSGSSYSYFRIPIQIEYLFPDGLIRPKFDVGFNYYSLRPSFDSESDKSLFFASSVGALIKITKSVYFDLKFDLDVCTLTDNIEYFPTHAFITGIYFQL